MNSIYVDTLSNDREVWMDGSEQDLDDSGGRTYSFVACLSHLTIDHASLSRRSTVTRGGGGILPPVGHVDQLRPRVDRQTFLNVLFILLY